MGRHSRCHHGTIIQDSWQECPECCDEERNAQASYAAQDAADEARKQTALLQELLRRERNGPVSEDEVLLRLKRNPLLIDTFIRRTNGKWNHSDWLSLLHDLRQAGYSPLHEDGVGLFLEQRRDEWRRHR